MTWRDPYPRRRDQLEAGLLVSALLLALLLL